MATKAEQEKFEANITRWKRHKNKQTFSADSSVAIYETIDTPGVSIAGKVGCLIGMVSILPIFGIAGTAFQNYWRTQILGGTKTAFLEPDDPKYVAELFHHNGVITSGVESRPNYPWRFNDGLQPILIVNPKMTIIHDSLNIPDLASEDVWTYLDYMNVQLTLEMHTAMMHDQMDLS